jgi:Type I site-specific restriction-modification system, R (restriction) subunit and related helicases
MELVNILVYNEEAYENALIELFQNLGYSHYYGPDVDRDHKNPLFKQDLENLYRINRSLDKEAIDKTIETIQDFGIGSLEDKNNKFTEYLQNGVSVNYWREGKEKSTHVKLIDFDDLDSNLFTVINQWTVVDKETKIPDIVVFVNGLPLVVCELKSPSREDADTSEAYTQLKKYMQVIPVLFNYNAFCVMSDMSISKSRNNNCK